jgi:hypothetical protein
MRPPIPFATIFTFPFDSPFDLNRAVTMAITRRQRLDQVGKTLRSGTVFVLAGSDMSPSKAKRASRRRQSQVTQTEVSPNPHGSRDGRDNQPILLQISNTLRIASGEGHDKSSLHSDTARDMNEVTMSLADAVDDSAPNSAPIDDSLLVHENTPVDETTTVGQPEQEPTTEMSETSGATTDCDISERDVGVPMDWE